MKLNVRAYHPDDVAAMVEIWNQVVRDGMAFPQLETLDANSGAEFFAAQTHCAVAETDGAVTGLYILHPNNLGRCGHIANASFAVAASARGLHIGEALVRDCLNTAPEFGFRILQFNAVVKSNTGAQHLYERLGFVQIGTVPGGFRNIHGEYEDILLYYHLLSPENASVPEKSAQN